MAVDVSDHLMASHRPLLDRLGVTTADKLLGLRNGTEVLVAGVRVATQTPPMRGGRRVVFISIDDGTGCVDSVFFHEAQELAGPAAVRHPAAADPGDHPADRAAGDQHQRQHGLGPEPHRDPAVPGPGLRHPGHREPEPPGPLDGISRNLAITGLGG